VTTALRGSHDALAASSRLQNALTTPAGVAALRILVIVAIVGLLEYFPWPASAKLWRIRPSATKCASSSIALPITISGVSAYSSSASRRTPARISASVSAA